MFIDLNIGHIQSGFSISPQDFERNYYGMAFGNQ